MLSRFLNQSRQYFEGCRERERHRENDCAEKRRTERQGRQCGMPDPVDRRLSAGGMTEKG